VSSGTLDSYYSANSDAHMAKPEPQKLFGPFVYQGEIKEQINSDRDLHEALSLGERCVIGLVRLLLPPHVDNEKAADYLRTNIGQTNKNRIK
jgi:hypothetical protein